VFDLLTEELSSFVSVISFIEDESNFWFIMAGAIFFAYYIARIYEDKRDNVPPLGFGNSSHPRRDSIATIIFLLIVGYGIYANINKHTIYGQCVYDNKKLVVEANGTITLIDTVAVYAHCIDTAQPTTN